MTTTTMNVSLPASMREFIDAQLEAGGYSTTSEYLRELVRADQIKKAEAQLRDLLMVGLNSGPSMPTDSAFFDNLEAKVRSSRATA